jgi:hypothetical protein
MSLIVRNHKTDLPFLLIFTNASYIISIRVYLNIDKIVPIYLRIDHFEVIYEDKI